MGTEGCRFVITPDGRPAVQDSADFAIMCGMSEHREKRDEDEAHCERGAQGRVAVWLDTRIVDGKIIHCYGV